MDRLATQAEVLKARFLAADTLRNARCLLMLNGENAAVEVITPLLAAAYLNTGRMMAASQLCPSDAQWEQAQRIARQ